MNGKHSIYFLYISIILIVIISIIFPIINLNINGQKIENKTIIKGNIIFNNLSSIHDATIIIYLEDITFKDTPAKLVRKEIIKHVNFDIQNHGANIQFSINGSVPDTNSIYAIRVDIDLNNDSIINSGDFISTDLHIVSPKMKIGYIDPLLINMTKIN